MEGLVTATDFWKSRSVFLTGATGFKGGWLALWLSELGAKVCGFSLAPTTRAGLFEEANLCERLFHHIEGDIRDFEALLLAMTIAEPSVVIHMAAQPLVRESICSPVETFATNLMGTINLMEAAKRCDSIEAIINVTSDKCYRNTGVQRPFVENDPLGGVDPYSCSKACAELASASYRQTFFEHQPLSLATARAGNVIGGGDWAPDRLIPDFIRALDAKKPLHVRTPDSVRPWQHVLEPLSGYLMLAERLVSEGEQFADSWNFGPDSAGCYSVSTVVEGLCGQFPDASWLVDNAAESSETEVLTIDSEKAKDHLGWRPRWTFEKALEKTADWYIAQKEHQPMELFSLNQIKSYLIE